MDSFGSEDRDALLKEIGQIKAALKPDKNLKDLINLYDEHDFDDEDDDENLAGSSSDDLGRDSDEDYIPDSESTRKFSPWYDRDYRHEDSSDEEDNEEIVLAGAKNLLRKNASTPSSFSVTPLTPATSIWEDSVGKASKGYEKSETFFLEKDPTLDPSVSSDLSLSSLECTLQLNRDYQAIVKDELVKINCALKQNKSKQTEVENQKKNAIIPKGILLARFRPTYFKDEFGQGPPDNEDTKERKINSGIDPFTKCPKLWTEKERQLLAEGVRNQNLERMTLKLKAELNELERQAKRNNTEVDKAVGADIKKRMTDLRNLPNKELEENLDDLDFFNISKLYLPHRTEAECRIRWLVSDHPRINQFPWTKEEDAKLISAAHQHKNRNWELIAQELGTLRTPIQCFQRFQRSLNKLLLKRGWTDEENEELLRVVNMCPKGDWQQVANLIDGRAAMQILHHYNKALKKGIRKGTWSKRENKLLLKYAKICGVGNWVEISKHIPGRTDASVRDRWVNNYEPGLKINVPWTNEEDELLVKHVEKYEPGNWMKISKEMEGRTDNMCMNRWKKVQPSEYQRYKEKLNKKRELLGYFVGRNHERPEISYEELKLPGEEQKKEKKRKRKKRKHDEADSGKEKRKECKIDVNEEQYIEGENQKEKDCDDPDYHIESNDSEYTYSSGSDNEDKSSKQNLEMNDEACNSFLQSGNNILLAFENGDAEYIDVKRELFLLKLKILKTTENKNRVKLQALNDKQFERMEAIKAKTTESSKPADSSSDEEPITVPIRNQKLLKKPVMSIEDTVFAAENIGIKSFRPVQLDHMPSNLAPFTLLLEAFHIDVKSVMQAVNKQSSNQSSTQEPSSNTTAANTVSSDSDQQPSIFHSIVPIAPNLVTLRAFRKLLLLRRRLVQLASLVPSDSARTNCTDLTQSSDNEQNAAESEIPSNNSFSVLSSKSGNLNKNECKIIDNSQTSNTKASKVEEEVKENKNNNTSIATTETALEIDSSLSSHPKLAYQDSYEYKALSARFNGLFMWPALLSTHIAREPVLRSQATKSEQKSCSTTRRRSEKKKARWDDLCAASETAKIQSDDLSLDDDDGDDYGDYDDCDDDDYKPKMRSKQEIRTTTPKTRRFSAKSKV